jgi:nitrogen fixation/metabolism regulation signal transduction histidine kinase
MKPLTGIPADDIDDMYSSLRTIEERSKGLLKFVGNYKDLTRMPQPAFMNIRLVDLFDNIVLLMKKTLDKDKHRKLIEETLQESVTLKKS